MKPTKFHKFVKVFATIAILGQGLYYAITQPGKLDTANGLIAALVVFSIWFAKDRVK